MTLPSLLDGLSEIAGALTTDPRGQLREATDPQTGARSASATAAAVNGLAEAGGAAGLARLELVLVRGPASSTVTAVRADELLRVAVDPAKGTAQVEKALHAWAMGRQAPAETPAPRADGPKRTTSSTALPPPLAAAPPPPPPPPLAAVTPPPTASAARPPPAPPAPAPAPKLAVAGRDDPWAALRHALARGQLTEAAARRRELADAKAASGRAGAEPIPPAELDAAMQTLVQGIGSVLAGDGVAGARTLEALTGDAQKNLSFRWLALYWSSRAAVKSGNSAAARQHLTQALLLAKRLDLEAVAVSQWVAAELLSHDADHRRALACLAAARSGFERMGDRWGIGQTWLAEARAYVALEREDEATNAARQAWASDTSWEEPALFLARRAIARDDLGEAEGMLRYLTGPSGERIRSLLEAIRRQVVTQADAAEFLRESEAPPTARSIRAMERIAQAAPRFVPAREALAWMLLKVGKYAEASSIFRGLLGQQLTQADRASVMLGLGCIAHAQQTGKDADSRLHAAVTAGSAPQPAEEPSAEVLPLPSLSTTSLPARSSQVAGGGAVFSGQLSVFALPDVMEFVRSARRTGLLVCSSEKGIAAMHFRDGRITGASAPGAPDVGEILVRARKLSAVALRTATASQPAGQPDHVIGELLLREGHVDAQALRDALRRKIELGIHEVLQWKDGEFAFNREADGDPVPSQGADDFDAQEVLLNVLKQMDEDARGRAAPAQR